MKSTQGQFSLNRGAFKSNFLSASRACGLALAWVTLAHCEVILDNTGQGTSPLSISGTPLNQSGGVRNGLVFQAGYQADLLLTSAKVGLRNPGSSGSYRLYLSLYEVDAQNNPVGPSLVTETYSGIWIFSTPGYYDFTLGTNGWSVPRGRKYMFEVAIMGGSIIWWVATTPPTPPAGGPWADFVAYRGSTDGIGWSNSPSFGAVEINATPIPGIPVMVNGTLLNSNSTTARGTALVTILDPYLGGTVFYTLDGSSPATGGLLYTGPFPVNRTSTLRVAAYTADFLHSCEADARAIVVLPNLVAATQGGGSVAIDPPAGDYFSNLLAVATATPAPGWAFLQWLGDVSGTNPVVNLSMTRNKTVQAVFGTPLTTAVVGGGSIVVRPVSALHPYGSQVRLAAVPATGNYLAFWANAASGQTNNPLLFVMTNANPTVTAVFASLGGTQTNALTVVPSGRGQVTLTPPGNRFPLNTNVVLQAIAEPGQEFIGWVGDAAGTQNPLVVTMNSNKVIAAAFSMRPRLQGEGHPELLRQDGFRLTVMGEFGKVYEIHAATDWSGWTLLGTVTNTWGTGQFTDPGATTNAQRWYRARALP